MNLRLHLCVFLLVTLLAVRPGDDIVQIGPGLLMNWLEAGLVRKLITG